VGVPALVVVALGYGFKRLDQRWEAEAHEYQAQSAGKQPEIRPEMPAPTPQPALPARKPVKQPQPLPFVPPPAVTKETQLGLYAQPTQPGISAPSKNNWESKACSSSVRAAFAATGLTDQPCWQVRFKVEGHVPEECVNCDIFQHYPTM